MIAPKARSVIWLFMIGGTSQMESFDPKPNLNRYQGKSIDETPFKAMLESPHLKTNLRELVPGVHKVHPKIFPMQIGYSKRGQSGIEVSDWWPHVGSCIDDIAVVRSMWTTDNNHGAQLQFHTGRHVLDGQFPTIGSWVHYGLGSLNENLPQFVVMGKPIAAAGPEPTEPIISAPNIKAYRSPSTRKSRCPTRDRVPMCSMRNSGPSSR
jgi:hypothetical protein